ncbi:hypothetical protein QM467_04340 [Rhodoblastus sp. 17X3]|uniref:hypothetical protein n=1 Tax=Rhodoblastus sp. 17X3 TaxID=3047026 RepID=UPI0024B8010F|nr:hypothetical protein [Rhodoblastus sp. 17X3]MDI9847289.1 hypothetical protein [Rhodoblastus sp. 17X3]
MTTYLISISRERLWLRSKKSEELYHKAEEAYFDLSAFFRERYELSQMIVNPHDAREITAINRHIVDLKILVGLYFPALGHHLSGVVAATATGFDQLRLAEASDESNRANAMQMLDYAVSGLKDSFDHFKEEILRAGQTDGVGKISDVLFNRSHRRMSERVLSGAA